MKRVGGRPFERVINLANNEVPAIWESGLIWKWLNLMCYPEYAWETVKETPKILIHDRGPLGRNLKPEPSEYESIHSTSIFYYYEPNYIV
jgi:hypothetical protein